MGCVTQETDILDAGRARVVCVHDQQARPEEELQAAAHAGRSLDAEDLEPRVLVVGPLRVVSGVVAFGGDKHVQEVCLLAVRGFHVPFAEAFQRGVVQPQDPAREDRGKFRILTGQQVDELGRSPVAPAGPAFVRRHDQLGEPLERAELVLVEVLDRVLALERLLVRDLAVNLGAFGRRDPPGHPGGGQRQRDTTHRRAARELFHGDESLRARHCPSSILRPDTPPCATTGR